VEKTPSFEVIRVAATDDVRPVDYRSVVEPETVRISYIDHEIFLIQTTGGHSVVTDHSSILGPADFIPDLVTISHAHGTHWTAVSIGTELWL
jgi:hypothetical protein